MKEPQPYFAPLTGSTSLDTREDDIAAVSREAAESEMAYLRALGRPRAGQPELPQLKGPVLPDDFAQRIADLDQEIFGRGIAIDADKLLSLGKERFEQLLAADRKAPRQSYGSGMTLVLWESVQHALYAFQAPDVPARTTAEQVAGSGKGRDALRRLEGFEDLWKATSERREVINDIYDFRDKFESLCFGDSLLAHISKDFRLRSRFFCGGGGRKLDLLKDWLPVVTDSLTRVRLVQPTWHLLGWLANEKSAAPSLTELARDWFDVRSPSTAQMRIAGSLLEGFLLDLDDWPLWEFVGRQTHTSIHIERLVAWRRDLSKRFPAIASFHAELRAGCYRDVGYGYEAHRQFEPVRHRALINRMIQERCAALSQTLALAVEASFPGSVLARFEYSVLCKGEPKQRAEITAHLAAAFPSACFPFEFEEVH